ncbi:MAG: hypothetical protein KGV43_00925 [Arcobacter sp.]|nr:hypothetical protein [Arcobacter sp.]
MLNKVKVFTSCVALASVLVACGGGSGSDDDSKNNTNNPVDSKLDKKEKVLSFSDEFISKLEKINKIYGLVFIDGELKDDFSDTGANIVVNSEVKNGIWVKTKDSEVKYIGLVKYVQGQYTKTCYLKNENDKECMDNKRIILTSHQDVFEKIKNKEIDVKN